MEFIRLSKHSKNSLDFLIYSWNSSYSDFHVVTYVTFEGISNLFIVSFPISAVVTYVTFEGISNYRRMFLRECRVVTYVTFEGISNKLRSNENFSEL